MNKTYYIDKGFCRSWNNSHDIYDEFISYENQISYNSIIPAYNNLIDIARDLDNDEYVSIWEVIDHMEFEILITFYKHDNNIFSDENIA